MEIILFPVNEAERKHLLALTDRPICFPIQEPNGFERLEKGTLFVSGNRDPQLLSARIMLTLEVPPKQSPDFVHLGKEFAMSIVESADNSHLILRHILTVAAATRN
jgi:hypothetical protein